MVRIYYFAEQDMDIVHAAVAASGIAEPLQLYILPGGGRGDARYLYTVTHGICAAVPEAICAHTAEEMAVSAGYLDVLDFGGFLAATGAIKIKATLHGELYRLSEAA